jgi:hypothetical protein
MKTKFLFMALLFQIGMQAQTVNINTSESDASIIVNGQRVGSGTFKLKCDSKECYKVKAEKPGFLKYENTVCGKKAGPEPPKNLYFEIQVNSDLDPTEAWKLTYQIVTDYFDAIEVSDKETSYLRTAWSVQSFTQNTIRTRLIIKLAKSSPLTFKVKLNSEFSGFNGTSVKADEAFIEWDRVLRKYQNVINDFSTRLQKK